MTPGDSKGRDGILLALAGLFALQAGCPSGPATHRPRPARGLQPPDPEPGQHANVLLWTPDGRYIVAGGHRLVLWDAESRLELAWLPPLERGVSTLSVDARGRLLVAGGVEGRVALYDLEAQRQLWVRRHATVATPSAIHPDGRIVVSGGSDGTLRIWTADGTWVRSVAAHRGGVSAVTIGAKGRLLITAGFDRRLVIWRLETLEVLREHRLPRELGSLVVGAGGRLLVGGGWDGLVRVWELSSGRLLTILRGNGYWAASVSVDPQGRRVAATSFYDRRASVWDLRTGRTLFQLPTPEPLAVAFDPRGRHIVTGRPLRLFDSRTGRRLRGFPVGAASGTSPWPSPKS